LKATPITGTPNIGEDVHRHAAGRHRPKIRISSAMTMKVSGPLQRDLTREFMDGAALRQGAWAGA